MASIAGQVRLKFMLYSWNAKVIAWDDDDDGDDGLWLTPRVGSLLCQRLQPHPHLLYPLCSSINLSKHKILKATLVLPVLSHLALSLKHAIYTYKFLYDAFRMGGFLFLRLCTHVKFTAGTLLRAKWCAFSFLFLSVRGVFIVPAQHISSCWRMCIPNTWILPTFF